MMKRLPVKERAPNVILMAVSVLSSSFEKSSLAIFFFFFLEGLEYHKWMMPVEERKYGAQQCGER